MAIDLAIKALQEAGATFSSQLLLPGNESYDKANGSYLSKLQSDISPAAIFQPKSTEDVAQLVSIIRPFVEKGVKFAIRGGGQQPAPGSANIGPEGITVDLSLLNSIELKDEDRVLSIGAGARWGQVYDKLDGTGLAVTGVRANNGGIGGLSLTGGHSFFSSREGFVTDNVVNFEIVLASGKVVNANAKENSDLFASLRGGGNNFGIVTRFDFRTFPQGPFWGGSVFYFPHSFPSQLDALVNELKKSDASEETHIMLSIGYAAQFGQTACQNQIYYTQEAAKTPEVLEPFAAIQPQIDPLNTLRKLTLKEAASEQQSDGSAQVRCAYMNATVKADAATLKAAADLYTAALEPVKPTTGLVGSLTIQPYPVSCLKQTTRNGGNSLGLRPSDGPLVNILLLTYWQNKEDDDAVLGFMKQTLASIREDAKARGTLVPFVFMNYAFTHQDPITGYGEENKKRLQETSKKYDPEGVFQKGVPGGWKLF